MTLHEDDGAVLGAIFASAVDAILVADATGTITRASVATAKLFGFELDELVGENIKVLMPPKFADEHDGYMDHHLDTGERRIIGIGREVEAMHKDGTVFPVHLSVGRAEMNNEPVFVGILHDLSDQRAAQEALSRSQRLDAVGQMTGGIAHDFNNLLTIIIGNLELLELKSAGKYDDLIHDALEAAELGSDLTNRLLTFAKKSDLAPKVLDLPEKCDEVVSILSRTMGEQYAIECRHGRHLPQINVDPGQLQTAILNLALNARDAMPQGGHLALQTDRVSIDDAYIAQETDILPGDYVRLSISDNGTGMTEAASQRAFEPFFTTKEAGKGTGLGLSMVYGFVRQSGGHVTLYSELGKGTTFALYFPVVAESEMVEPAASEDDSIARGRGQVIMVVEDNDKVRRLSIARLKDLGYNPIPAETGDAALALLEELGSVDLLFTDLVMPGSVNGYELAKRVQEMFPEMRVLLTSGYASDVVDPELAKAEFPILRKPYRLPDLAKSLGDLLAS
ncbi:MAG: PAS domain S-box protein [Pseudomonadota bacterium]